MVQLKKKQKQNKKPNLPTQIPSGPLYHFSAPLPGLCVVLHHRLYLQLSFRELPLGSGPRCQCTFASTLRESEVPGSLPSPGATFNQ